MKSLEKYSQEKADAQCHHHSLLEEFLSAAEQIEEYAKHSSEKDLETISRELDRIVKMVPALKNEIVEAHDA